VRRAAQCSRRSTLKSLKAAQNEEEMTMGVAALELEVWYGVEWRPSFPWVDWPVRRKDAVADYYYYSKDPCWPSHRRHCVDGPWLARMLLQYELECRILLFAR
jgi:hypothetical protein